MYALPQPPMYPPLHDRTLIALFALCILVGCGSPGVEPIGAGDAGPPPDATIVVRGSLGLFDTGFAFSFAQDFEACLAAPGGPCSGPTTATGAYAITVPANAEIALRFAHVSDGTLWPWLKPLHTGAADFNAAMVAMPRPAVIDSLLARTGGITRADTAALIYVERAGGASLLDGGVAGYSVAASAGTVLYVASDGTTTIPDGRATTEVGLVLVTGIPASVATLRLRISAPPGESRCRPPADQEMHLWVRPNDPPSAPLDNTLTVDAPVMPGHMTYAAFLYCPDL